MFDDFAIPMGFIIFMLIFAVFMIAAMWKIYEKAGQEGWKAIIPFYTICFQKVLAKMKALQWDWCF
jgi:mannose/fructose/N-acetylgalactosamine-specific phosphotransferase system component IID